MDFKLEHSFPADTGEVAAALLDERFQASLQDIEPLRVRQVLSQEERNDGTVLRRVRCVLDMQLSSTVQRLVGTDEASWVEEATWRPEQSRWDWTIVPDAAKDLLSSSGVVELEQRGGQTVRRVTGQVSVRVPLYGSKVERWIVAGIEEAYAQEAERLREWLAS